MKDIKIQVRVTDKLLAKIDAEALSMGQTRSEHIRWVLEGPVLQVPDSVVQDVVQDKGVVLQSLREKTLAIMKGTPRPSQIEVQMEKDKYAIEKLFRDHYEIPDEVMLSKKQREWMESNAADILLGKFK